MIEIARADVTALDTIAAEINSEHRACEEALQAGLAHAVRGGELLVEAKNRVQHGEWGRWLEDNFDGSARTAQAYMKVAREIPNLGETEAQRVADLSFRGALKELSAPEEDGQERWPKEEIAKFIREYMDVFGPGLWEGEKPLFEKRLSDPGPQEDELVKDINVEVLHQMANQVAVDGFLLEIRDGNPVLTYRTPDKSRIHVEPMPTHNPEAARANIERGSKVDAVCNFMVWRHLENWPTAVVVAESADTDVILRRVEHNADWRKAEPAGEFLRQQCSEHRKEPKDFAAERGLCAREFQENLGAVRVWVGVEALRWARMLAGETKEGQG